MQRLWNSEESGFSLVEVLVAMVLIVTMGAVFSRAIFTGFKASTNNKERLAALVIAENALEDIRKERNSIALGEVTRNEGNYIITEKIIKTDITGLYDVIVEVQPPAVNAIILATRILADI